MTEATRGLTVINWTVELNHVENDNNFTHSCNTESDYSLAATTKVL